ncbi:MAG: epoxyqueuosine reductase QueH [Planctomycetota bacterium]
MRVLLHICCAHCMDKMLAGLRAEFGARLEVLGFFYNPNIHPLLEFRKRLKAVRVLNETLRIPIDYHEPYGLEDFLRFVWRPCDPNRCRRCYDLRLFRAAQHAHALGLDAMTTTLCVSPHQDHVAIREAGEEAAEAHAVKFLYRDLRSVAEETPRRIGIYAQQYCGCIFSENERFVSTNRELYKGNIDGEKVQSPPEK